jgi:hypothetical protein
MTTRKNLIAEVLSDLKQYNESGLTIYHLTGGLKNALLKFGGTIMPKLDKVIEVREGSSTTENFYALQLAAKCTPKQ